MSVTYEIKDKKIYVNSIYKSNLPDLARNIGGRWSSLSLQWVFDEREFDDVKDLYLELYGEFGEFNTEKVDLSITFDVKYQELKSSINIDGIEIARAFSKSSNVKILSNIIIRNGGFSSGGSNKNWYTIAEKNTIVEIHDIPMLLAIHVINNTPDGITIKMMNKNNNNMISLQKEKEKLLLRISEINKILETGFDIDEDLKDEN